MDLMGRLSNPPETLECVDEQGERDTPPPRRTTSKGTKRSSNPPEAGDLEEKGQLSNPVQRRLSPGVVDDLTHFYKEGASIDALGRRYGVHRTTIIAQLDRRGVTRRHVTRKMTDPLVTRASKRFAKGFSRRCGFGVRCPPKNARPGVPEGRDSHPGTARLESLSPPEPTTWAGHNRF